MMNRDIRTEATDLRATRFQNAQIWLPALIRASLEAGEPLITGRTFFNCLLYGPAVFLATGGVTIGSSNLGDNNGDVRHLVLRPESPTGVIGTVPFQDCRFEFCDFHDVGFTGNERFIDAVLKVPAGELP